MRRQYFSGLGEASVTQTAPAISEEPKKLVYKKSLTAGQVADDEALAIDKTYDFEFLAIAGKSTGDYEINFKDASGRDIFSARASADLVVGTGQFPIEFDHPLSYPAGGRIQISIADLSGGGNDVELLFIGIAKYPAS